MGYSEQLFQFIEQSSTDSLVTRDYDDSYNELTVKVSFGQGVLARIPWVSFLKEPNTTSKGIYPVYLLYKNIDKLVLAYCISEENPPNQSWNLTNPQSISEYFANNNLGRPARYGSSYVYEVYDVEDLPSEDQLDSDLDEIISIYTDNMSLNKRKINDAIEITKRVVETHHENFSPEERQDIYNTQIKPHIDSYKDEFGQTPQLFVKSIIKKVFDENNFSEEKYSYNSNGHWGNGAIRNYVMGYIALKEHGNAQLQFTRSPQLALGFHDSAVRFGFFFGDNISDTDPTFTEVLSDNELLSEILSTVNNHPILSFSRQSDEDGSGGAINVEINNINDLRDSWDRGIKFFVRIEQDNLDNNSFDEILETLNYLAPIFKKICNKRSSTNTDNLEVLNIQLIEEIYLKYINHCNTTNWLQEEKYKFKFANWVFDNTDIQTHSDEEILRLAIESQEQNFVEGSNVTGVNFIKSELRFNDQFITLQDISYLRALVNQSFKDPEPSIEKNLAHPKISVWASCLNPSEYLPYASSDLQAGLSYITSLEGDYPKTGFKAFQHAQLLMHGLKDYLLGREEIVELYENHLSRELTKVDWSWIVQDFTFFISKIIAMETTQEDYTIDDATSDLFLSEEEFRDYLDLLNSEKNIILQGPPGVGKTYIAKKLAHCLLNSRGNDRIEMIQFHQSYSYEDFIQGYRPDGEGGFKLETGIFYKLCEKARLDSEKNYVLIIDEINRGNLSKIFGELLMLIEADKRGEEYEVSLTYSPDDKFSVPENLYLIGTMNTADRSIAMVDYALRRRFSFIMLLPQFNTKFEEKLSENGFTPELSQKIIQNIKRLNETIRTDINLGEGFQVGHSYFCPDGHGPYNNHWYEKKIKYKVEPLLREYWFDNPETVQSLVEDLNSV